MRAAQLYHKNLEIGYQSKLLETSVRPDTRSIMTKTQVLETVLNLPLHFFVEAYFGDHEGARLRADGHLARLKLQGTDPETRDEIIASWALALATAVTEQMSRNEVA